ncbi:MAG: amidase family protein, partial [Candidatus Puniceispirillales bacterium]
MEKNNLNYTILEKRIQNILTEIQNKPKKFENIFTELFNHDFHSQLEFIKGLDDINLKGLIISIKDLFNVKGYKTRGGSLFLDPLPCLKDASCISLLRKSGALLLGHTNMTELAYSGLGINPHYGTPENPIYKGSVPGGSTSG